jgi:hypothetical protein
MGGFTREAEKLGLLLGFKGKAYSHHHIEESDKSDFLGGYRSGELLKQNTIKSIDFPMPSSILSPDFQQILNDYFDLQYFRTTIFDTWMCSLSKFLGNNLDFNKNIPSHYNGINIKLLESLEKKCLNEYLIVLKLKIKYLKTTRNYKQGKITKDEYKELRKELKKEIYS